VAKLQSPAIFVGLLHFWMKMGFSPAFHENIAHHHRALATHRNRNLDALVGLPGSLAGVWFGGACFSTRIERPQYFWVEKLDQILIGLSFGLAGAVVFTLAENTLNMPRVNWKSWLIVLASWLVVKVAFVSVGAALG
jgi:hypothetical protein